MLKDARGEEDPPISSDKQDSAGSGKVANSAASEYRLGRPAFVRYATQHLGLLAGLLITGFIVGIAYRALVDDPAERELANYVRSGLHGAGLALAVWTVQAGFASTARYSFGVALRRLPVAGEVLVRAFVMTVALTIVGVALQFLLYAEPLQLRWFTISWFTTTLPRIIAIGFAMSLVVGAITEAGRLIGGPVLISVVLGTYHRPAREERIVMFLDIAGSTRLAEENGGTASTRPDHSLFFRYR